MANPENLVPIKKGQLSKEEATRRGTIGGIKSGEARKQKKLLSQQYADVLSKENGVINGKLDKVIESILAKGGVPAVMLLKELREGTENSTLKELAKLLLK